MSDSLWFIDLMAIGFICYMIGYNKGFEDMAKEALRMVRDFKDKVIRDMWLGL